MACLFITALERGPAVRTGATEKRLRARPHSSHCRHLAPWLASIPDTAEQTYGSSPDVDDSVVNPLSGPASILGGPSPHF